MSLLSVSSSELDHNKLLFVSRSFLLALVGSPFSSFLTSNVVYFVV